MVKMQPYKTILKMGKEAIDAVLASTRANKAKKQAELKIAEIDESMAATEAKIHELCSSKEAINFDQIIVQQDNYAKLERKKKQLNRIISEMFPED